jgi:hypothetical protein
MAGAVMTVVTLILAFFETNFILNILISAVTYFGVLWALREPLLRELKTTLQGSV